jgi:hypothetical protein
VSATREYRNLGKIEDAVAAVGATITVLEHLYDALGLVLPDDGPALTFEIGALRAAHTQLSDRLGA